MVAPGRKRCRICGVEYSCDPYLGHNCKAEDIAKVFDARIESAISRLRQELVLRIAEEVTAHYTQHPIGEPVPSRNLCDVCAVRKCCDVPEGPSEAPDVTLTCGRFVEFRKGCS